MAAIDKIYVKGFNKYLQVVKWLKNNPLKVYFAGEDRIIPWDYYEFNDYKGEYVPVGSYTYLQDKWLIKNCPLLQEEYKEIYKEEFNNIKNSPLFTVDPQRRYNCRFKYKGSKRGLKNSKGYIQAYDKFDNFLLFYDDYKFLCNTSISGDVSTLDNMYPIPWDFTRDIKCKSFKALIRKLRNFVFASGDKISYYTNGKEYIIKAIR